MASSSSFHPAHATGALHSLRQPPIEEIEAENEKSYNTHLKMSNSSHFPTGKGPSNTLLYPFKSLRDGKIPNKFPRNLEEFYALDSQTLDELAKSFDQDERNELTSKYPLQSRYLFGKSPDLKMKRELFGGFIGLEGDAIEGPPIDWHTLGSQTVDLQQPSKLHRPSISAPGVEDKYDPKLDPAPKKKKGILNWLRRGGGRKKR
ncbi:unnamed protein product [Penicillium bialowiezense]